MNCSIIKTDTSRGRRHEESAESKAAPESLSLFLLPLPPWGLSWQGEGCVPLSQPLVFSLLVPAHSGDPLRLLLSCLHVKVRDEGECLHLSLSPGSLRQRLSLHPKPAESASVVANPPSLRSSSSVLSDEA